MKKFAIIFSVILVLFLISCRGETPAPTATLAPTNQPATNVPVEETTSQPTLEETATQPESALASGTPDELAAILGNLSYSGLFPDREITLTDGFAPYDEGDGGSPYVQLIDHLIVTGDLDGDGAEDAVTFLVDHSTGSGDFTFLAAVLDVWGDPVSVDALMVGDRSPVKSLSVEDAQVTVELIGPEAGDPNCCPTWNVITTFDLAGGELVENSSEVLSKAALDDLSGTSWQLVDLNLDQEPALPDAEVTLSIADGQISGSAGCNTYNSAVTGDENIPSAVTVGPIATTRMACPDPIMAQEITYLERLAQVTSWSYHFGYLALTYRLEGGTFGDMLFAPVSAGMMADAGEALQADALWASDWQWVSFTSPVEQFDIDMPENYQLIFFDDGTFQIVADCNNAGGAFADEEGALTIEMFQSTLALCPGDSRSEQFVELLGGASRYFFEDGNLFIDLMADGGTLEFAPVPVPNLVNTPWQWISFTGNSGQFDVETPESYILTLLEDGSLSIVADCNTVLSDYTTDGESLSIAPGAATLALCSSNSRSEQFVQLLVGAKGYFIERNNLFVVVEEDGGTMVFGLADEMAVDTPSLTVNPWQWTSFTNPVEQFEVETPESYQLAFNEDSTLNIVADCNNGLGNYTEDAGALSIEFGPMTMAACPGGSRSDQFVQYLMGAARYFFEDGNLYIDLMADGGTMVFEPVNEANAQDEQPVFGKGVFWEWSTITDPVNGETAIDDGLCTLTVTDDGVSVLSAPCWVAVADHQLEGNTLTLSFDLPEKLEESCEEGPIGKRFFELLQVGTSYFTEDGNLFIDLMADAGTLAFIPHDPQAAAEAANREANQVESWDEALEAFLAKDVCLAPGGLLLADTPQGRFLKAQGLASIEDGTPLAASDSFEIGSNTKSFTVVLALQLQEEGVWSLDDLLQTYLPEQAAKLPYGDQVTLRQLAQNNTDIPDYADGIIGTAILSDTLEQAYTPAELVDYVIENLDPSFTPGENWEYSTNNFILLGMAIEAVTGQSLADLYQERIFDPLEMNNSFLLEGVPEQGQIVQGYYTLDDGEVKNVTAWNGSQGWAGGGINITAEDMAKYTAGLASGALFQDPDSLEQTLSFDGQIFPFLGGYGLGVGQWTADPQPGGLGARRPDSWL